MRRELYPSRDPKEALVHINGLLCEFIVVVLSHIICTFCRLGIVLARLDQLEKTQHGEEILKHLEKAAQLDPKDPFALYLLGM